MPPSHLDPATYTFKVKASNNDGLWNEEGASLIIHVMPPWWETWWFRMFGIFFIVVSAYGFYRHRVRVIAKHNKELIALVNDKTKELLHSQEELAAQNEELIQSEEETSAQRDLLSQQNQTLTEAQKIIEQQNENLEVEVANRTKELVEYNQQLEQFAFISAHNLRAPVARILGLGHLLSLPQNTPEEKDQIYPKLVYAAVELDGVVKDLSTILRIKKNSDSFTTDIDLEKEILMVKMNLEHEIQTTQTTITTDFVKVETIRSVKLYMDSILYNLISNAIKYRHPNRNPVIHIKTEIIGNEICLSVTDNGLGIEMDIFRDKLFTLYSRFHLHVEGKGMGLYLVKTQMMAMGGRIEVESEVNVGTTFRAYFKDSNQ